MKRPATILLAFGLVAGLAWWAVAASMPGYFAAWLFCIGVPMGALPIVMGLEGAGATGSPLLPVLRSMLPLLPLGIVLALPLLGSLSGLFGRPDLPGALPGWWTAPAALALRDGIILIVLSLFALLFWITPRRPRRALAALGLLLSLFLGAVLGVDWVLAPQPALGSSLAGLLLNAGQMALAGALAGLIVAVRTGARDRVHAHVGLLLGLLMAFWVFLQFAQFLVTWSANLPEEAGWYVARFAGSGTPIVAFAAVAGLAGVALLPSLLGRIPVAMATLSAMIVLALLLVTLLFVLPAFHGRMTLGFADLLALLGFGGLLAGAIMLLSAPRAARAR